MRIFRVNTADVIHQNDNFINEHCGIEIMYKRKEMRMLANHTDIRQLEELYHKSGNQLVVLYGQRDCRKEELIQSFVDGKKYFYYRCRQASALAQNKMFGEEIARRFSVKLQKYTYDEYFNRVRSGDPTKLVIVIDEAQYLLKKDPEFLKSLIKLRMKRLYPGPVMIILASSSIVWVEQEMEELFGEDAKRIDAKIKMNNLNFLDVVRAFPDLSVKESIQIYGVLGGVPGYLKHWDSKRSFKENICSLVLSPDGYLYHEAENHIASELRELSVYNTILATIASGKNKLNDLFHETGFSRAKISVYMKNLAHFDIVEKLVSFETGGWENAKKGVYQIRATFVNFWFKFVYPHQSDLYLMSGPDFYDRYIAPEIDNYLKRYFRNVCMEYLLLLDQMGRLPFAVHKVGTWVGKTGNIDIIAQSSDRRNLIGFCNWDKPQMTMAMCEEMATAMDKAKLNAEHYYLFSATDFEPALKQYVQRDSSFILIDMKEL